MEGEYQLLVAFPDESASFTNGFEAGQMWERLSSGAAEVESTGHAENEEVFRRMATHFGYSIEVKPTTVEGWTDYRFVKSRKELTRPAPHLTVVSEKSP